MISHSPTEKSPFFGSDMNNDQLPRMASPQPPGSTRYVLISGYSLIVCGFCSKIVSFLEYFEAGGTNVTKGTAYRPASTVSSLSASVIQTTQTHILYESC